MVRRVWVGALIFFVTLAIFMFGLIAYANTYPDTVLPGISIGSVPVGGMNKEELKRFLQDMNDKLVNDGFHFIVHTPNKTEEFVIYPVIVTETASYELMVIDVDAEVERIIGYGKRGNVFARAVATLNTRVRKPSFHLEHIRAADDKILETLRDFVEPLSTPRQDANIIVTHIDPLAYTIVSSTPGITFAFDTVVSQLVDSWRDLQTPQIELRPIIDEPTITYSDAQGASKRLQDMFEDGSIELVFDDPNGEERVWTISTDMMSAWVSVVHNEKKEVVLGLLKEDVFKYFEQKISPEVTIESQDARFHISENGKVSEFQGSHSGVRFDEEATFAALMSAFESRFEANTQTVQRVDIVTEVSEPEVKTAEVNDLGISEVLGVGVSSYKGSPSNRIKNIRNAVQKLNGVLIKPGEIFSAIVYTQPYTIEGGYLPELVIKGDEIKPEIGGGLCQIGTTLFRMAMNSGMLITKRQNHSLVVNYYNDPSNGLPGTDATIYEPRPDFSFRNDTNNYILIQTFMDEVKQELRFSIWGTGDGRKGSYTPPTVLRWIAHGETKIVKTTKLAPGVRTCQHAYTGADTLFTYTRVMPDGTQEKEVFESHYRPLPQICLEGADPVELACEEGQECEQVVVDEIIPPVVEELLEVVE